MNDLTILFYSACRVEEPFFSNIRNHLLQTIGNLPLISITHKPLDFGQNIVTPLPISTHSIYKQILIGANQAQTKFIACAEDDCLYTRSHFELRPPNQRTFIYNKSRWWVESSGVFRWRDRSGMHCCIAPRQLLIDTLELRFEKYPVMPETRKGLDGWAEPGRYEWYLKLPKVAMEYVFSDQPVLTFNRKGSLGGIRRMSDSDTYEDYLAPWGRASDIWNQFHGNMTSPPPIR